MTKSILIFLILTSGAFAASESSTKSSPLRSGSGDTDTETYDRRQYGVESGAKMNSQQRMEQRQNNSSVIIQSDKPTKSDGRDMTRKDSRTQGTEYHKDSSDFTVEEEE